jgi:membrane carboxypeptidase/penicillin-binding protein
LLLRFGCLAVHCPTVTKKVGVFVPNLVTGVWVGNEDRSALSKYYLRAGATAALPVWAYFMKLLC